MEEAVVTTFDDVDSGANDTITTKRRAKLVRFYRSSKIYVIDLMHGDVCCAVGPLLPACFARIEYDHYSQYALRESNTTTTPSMLCENRIRILAKHPGSGGNANKVYSPLPDLKISYKKLMFFLPDACWRGK